MITPDTRLIDLNVAQLREVIADASGTLHPNIPNEPGPDIIEIDEACRITHLARQSIYQQSCNGRSIKKNELPLPIIRRPGSKKLLFSRKALQLGVVIILSGCLKYIPFLFIIIEIWFFLRNSFSYLYWFIRKLTRFLNLRFMLPKF